jgi:CheY-like chemotaxis protein
MIRVLLLEDILGHGQLIVDMITEDLSDQISITWVDRLGDAITRLEGDRFDAVLCSINCPGRDIEIFHTLLERRPNLPILILANAEDDRTILEALRDGAQGCLIKDKLTSDLLYRSLQFAITRKEVEEAFRFA